MEERIPLTTTQDLANGAIHAAFHAIALRDRFRQIRRSNFPAGPLRLDQLMPLGDVELAEQHDHNAAVLLRIEPRMIVSIVAGRGQADIAVAGDEPEAVERVADAFVAALRDQDEDEDAIPITFWAGAHAGALSARRRVAAPRWEEIRDNYASPVRAALDPLMRATGPGPGRLVLLHGAPGSGKSYALRALAREWEPWCDSHFISDPDALLGSRSSYLLSTLLRTPRRADGTQAWRLVILEDAGELLAADARSVTGQALSRLLNVTDGLLGEGLRTLVVVTTNEPVRRLHEAVARPGRCWAQVEFGALSAADADAWLRARGAAPARREATLAELYAIADGRAVARRAAIGFS
jgi:hypothetical protein